MTRLPEVDRDDWQRDDATSLCRDTRIFLRSICRKITFLFFFFFFKIARGRLFALSFYFSYHLDVSIRGLKEVLSDSMMRLFSSKSIYTSRFYRLNCGFPFLVISFNRRIVSLLFDVCDFNKITHRSRYYHIVNNLKNMLYWFIKERDN